MTAVPFDTLKLAERLEAGGFAPEQAALPPRLSPTWPRALTS
jgi:hypothetical protein